MKQIVHWNCEVTATGMPSLCLPAFKALRLKQYKLMLGCWTAVGRRRFKYTLSSADRFGPGFISQIKLPHKVVVVGKKNWEDTLPFLLPWALRGKAGDKSRKTFLNGILGSPKAGFKCMIMWIVQVFCRLKSASFLQNLSAGFSARSNGRKI